MFARSGTAERGLTATLLATDKGALTSLSFHSRAEPMEAEIIGWTFIVAIILLAIATCFEPQ